MEDTNDKLPNDQAGALKEVADQVIDPTPEQPPYILLKDVDLSKRYADVIDVIEADEVTGVSWRDGAYLFTCANGIQLRVYILENGLVRFWYSPNGAYGADFSYAISPNFVAEKPFATLNETENEYLISTPLLQVVIKRSKLSVKIYDAQDVLLCEDESGYTATYSVMRGWTKLRNTFRSQKKTGFYGLGDKSTPGNLRGYAFENWCSDAYGFGDQEGAWYRAIPFFYVKSGAHCFGIFLDNTYKTFFDFGKEKADTFTVGADGGELNYYFIFGPSALEVAARYHRLTGVHDLPPMWALGFHQSRWSYTPDARVLQVAQQFRAHQIPCDAIYLDIDYMDAYKVFTWNSEAFPNPKGLVSDLAELQFKTVAMIDPGVKAENGYAVYDTGLEKNYFIKTADGELVLAPVWPGLCAFPDFTHPDVRRWFGNLYAELYVDIGVHGIWNDMNEPAVFYTHAKTLPDTAQHYYEGHRSSHRKAHNVYGMQMSRSTYEGLQRLKPEVRPFLLSRASYSGGQRYAALWTGDNYASWQHLQIANVQAVRLSISGFSMVGSDIGGFAGDPDPELYLRWLQLSVFHPVMRVHSQGDHASGDNLLTAAKLSQDREPWAFGEKWTALNKKAIELRYFLLAAMYTACWRLKSIGKPILRPVGFEDHDPRQAENDRDFLFGDHILVSPVITAKAQRQMINLPPGQWYYFWTGQVMTGGSDVFFNVQLEEIPFFVREGAVLPIYPIRQSTSEVVKELTLYAYYKLGSETSYLYEDEGDGYAHETEDYSSRLELLSEGTKDHFELRVKYAGKRTPTYQKVTVIAVGLPYFVRKCMVDGAEFPIREIRVRDRSIYSVQLQPGFNTISWSAGESQ